MKSERSVDPFVDQLASLCRAHVTRSKWVFVPSHAIGRTLGERIALGGTNWLNLRGANTATRAKPPERCPRSLQRRGTSRNVHRGLCRMIQRELPPSTARRAPRDLPWLG